jgi:hypothetical protein
LTAVGVTSVGGFGRIDEDVEKKEGFKASLAVTT